MNTLYYLRLDWFSLTDVQPWIEHPAVAPPPPPPPQSLNLAPGKPIRYTARINGKLVSGTYEEIQALILRIAEQEAEKAADEAIQEARKPRRAPFLRILPGKPVDKPAEVESPRIVAKPLVAEYEDAYRRFLEKLISERLAAQLAAEIDDEEALLLLL